MQNQAAEQVVKTLKEANNVLVTVKNSPSVDELTAAIGLTLILNRMDKHAITVFSGRVPSTLEFLQPEMAIDTTTDSLRDFIIALDKSKADKLRYKVEDNVVRIFITPYKSSITENDLDFSQGDFNVDAVVALGVVTKEDFDQAVTAHGRILHDATVLALTKHEVVSQIGAINWQETQASSISEMITSITDQLGPDVLDGQIATALLTGIVSETDRFKNANTTPRVLSLSSKLMSAGANQQLIAEKLDAPDMSSVGHPLNESKTNNKIDDGALEINHDDDSIQKIHIDDSGNLQLPEEQNLPIPQQELDSEQSQQPVSNQNEPEPEPKPEPEPEPTHSYIQKEEAPQQFDQDDIGSGTAQPLFKDNANPQSEEQPNSNQQENLVHKKVINPLKDTPEPNQNTEASPSSMTDEVQTLTDLEHAVGSPHIGNNDDFTNVDDFLGSSRPASVAVPDPPAQEPEQPSEPEQAKQEPQQPASAPVPTPKPEPQVIDPTSPPAVPPPLMPQALAQPQFFDADGTNDNPFLNPNN